MGRAVATELNEALPLVVECHAVVREALHAPHFHRISNDMLGMVFKCVYIN